MSAKRSNGIEVEPRHAALSALASASNRDFADSTGSVHDTKEPMTCATSQTREM